MTDLQVKIPNTEETSMKPPFINGERAIVKIAFIYNFSCLTRNCSFRISKHIYDWSEQEEGYIERVKPPVFGKPEVPKIYKSKEAFEAETYLNTNLPFFELSKTYLSDNVSQKAINDHIRDLLEKLNVRINECHSMLDGLPSALPFTPNDDVILGELGRNYQMFLSLVSMAYDKLLDDEKTKLVE